MNPLPTRSMPPFIWEGGELPPDFEVRDLDLSPDGREAVLEWVQDRSEVALVKLAPQSFQ